MSFEDAANRMRERHQEGMIPVQPIEPERKSGMNGNIVFGLILIAVGVIITAVTYDSASREGGTYVVAYGPIIVGVIRLFKGLAGG
jgi:hypothetical protein